MYLYSSIKWTKQVIYPFYSWGGWGSEKLNILPTVTQRTDRDKPQIQGCQTPEPKPFPLNRDFLISALEQILSGQSSSFLPESNNIIFPYSVIIIVIIISPRPLFQIVSELYYILHPILQISSVSVTVDLI